MDIKETIVETLQGSIKIVQYNKPKKKNAIDGVMYKRVSRILNDAATDDSISVMVLTGTGDFYSSGNDFSNPPDSRGNHLDILKDYINAFIMFPKLLVAIVNGPAIGIAATTLALCDLVFASENSYFYTPFTKLGIVAEGCSTFTFPRILGERKALEMLLCNYRMPAAEALEYGFVNYIYKPEELQNELYELLQTDPVKGLTTAKAQELLNYYGPNTLTPATENGWPVMLFKSLCTGVVLCCGDLTALGRVAGLAARLTPAPSPLSREIHRFMRYMSIWALGLGFFIAAACLFLGYPFIQTIIFVIGMVVANIPEAFDNLKICGAVCSNANMTNDGGIRGDATETAILNFLVKYNDPIGIRRNFPKVAEIPFNSVNKFQVSVHLDISTQKFIVVMKGAPEIIFARCLTVATNTKDINFTNDMKKSADAVIEHLANNGERIMAFADFILKSNEYPPHFAFDTDNINFPVTNLRLLGVMGLMDPPREEVRTSIERVRQAGVRVMMVTGDHPATARAVALKVGIATSDKCHVVTGNELRSMTPELLHWTLDKHYEIVFARTSPTQKLQIVEACQREGGVVAVTGDGVNDAPALKRADIGISMGITGSQVSKQTADIILMDDNFSTIVIGIEEGRRIFDNLKKSVCYILISNVPEIAPVFMFILFSIPLPLGVMTILCIDLGTDMWPAVALAYEQAESDVMARPVRHPDTLVSARMLRLIYGHLGLIEFAAGMYAYFIVMAEYGFYPGDLFGIRQRWDNEAVTDLVDSRGQEWTYAERKEVERASQAAYFVAVVLTQMTNGVICKTRYNSLFHVGMKNKVLNMGLVFELLLTCAICYIPGVNDFFHTYPLQLKWYWRLF
ncbi:hypothetical protein PYW07_013886 [Mythimna separata]|uniref:Cation-transporting P-type ATPase C-terminal domain-containing protein n=1 Tax=Mythimna separata TaxID=271217 RepID=A0AAD7YEY6_MYTSE|nr:hypothetical protein PYW07_013886 [Mythimna separata]